MKHFSLLKNISVACLALATVVGLASCSGISDPVKASQTLKTSSAATVFSYNDTGSPRIRECVEAGPLPARAANALTTWLHHSTPKTFSYIYPQYYVTVSPAKGKTEVWALCSDAHGHFVGVAIPRHGVPAWDMPYAAEHIVYVCEHKSAKDLGQAIMDSIADAGYDATRINTRKAAGLTPRYLISKTPTTEQENRLRRERIEKAKKDAQNNMKNAAANSGMEDDNSAGSLDLGGDDDFGSSSSGDDEEESGDDGSDEEAAAASSDEEDDDDF